MARFLLSRKWIVAHLFVLIVVAGCVVAGFWQLDRLHQRRAFNARVEAQLTVLPVLLDRLIPAGSSPDPGALAYRRVEVEGTYDHADEVILLGRELDDNPGNHVLTPLLLPDGGAIVVDRGWVPFDLDRPPVAPAAPPGGTVRLTGVLFPSEVNEVSSPASGEKVTTLTKLDLGRIAQRIRSSSTLPLYLWLQTQQPGQAGSLPRRVPLPELSEGPHLSYSIQWFSFALIGMVGYPIFIRREMARTPPHSGRDQ
jgi:surfeit locus 1 family protein